MTSYLVTIATDSHQTCVKMRRQVLIKNRFGKIQEKNLMGVVATPPPLDARGLNIFHFQTAANKFSFCLANDTRHVQSIRNKFFPSGDFCLAKYSSFAVVLCVAVKILQEKLRCKTVRKIYLLGQESLRCM